MNMLNGFLDHELQNLPNDTHNNPPGPLHRQKHARTAPRKLEHIAQYNAAQLPHTPSHKHNVSQHTNATTCVPCRQKNAADFLEGNTPGVMAFYAPEQTSTAAEYVLAVAASAHDENSAFPYAQNAALESDETVKRLVEWREDAPYG